MERIFKMARFGPQLWGPEKAATIRPILLRLIESAEPGDIIVLDWVNVEVCDVSFGQEFLVRLLREQPHAYPHVFLLSTGLGELVQLNLQLTLMATKRMHPVRTKDGLTIIGRTHPADLRTLEAIRSAGGASTAPALAGTLGVKLTAMNQRLAKLLAHGLVQRTESLSEAGREQYSYKSSLV